MIEPTFLGSVSAQLFHNFGLTVPIPQPVEKGTNELSRIPVNKASLLVYIGPLLHCQSPKENLCTNIVSLLPVPKVGVAPSCPTHDNFSVAAQGNTVLPALMLTYE